MPPKTRRAPSVPTPPPTPIKKRPHLQITAGVVAIAAIGIAAQGLGIPNKLLKGYSTPPAPVVTTPVKPTDGKDKPTGIGGGGDTACSASIEQIVTHDNDPENNHIAIGGSDAWQSFGEYRVTAHNDDINLVRIYVSSSHPGQLFDEVAVASSGTIRGRGVLPAGLGGRTIDVGVP